MVREIRQLLSDARAEPGPCRSCGQDGPRSLGMDHASQQLRSPLLGLGGTGWEAELLQAAPSRTQIQAVSTLGCAGSY